MLEAAIIAVRLLQYSGATVLFGSSLFLFYALPKVGSASAGQTRGTRALLAGAGAVLTASALLSLPVQASLFAGSFADGFTRESITAVVGSMGLGKAALVRVMAAGTATLAVLLWGVRRWALLVTAALGGVAAASLGWMGHGGATEGVVGWLHLLADIAHAIAAAAWLGALAGFALLLLARDPTADATHTLSRTLHLFAGIGTVFVAVLLLTGLVNTWVLVGPNQLGSIVTSPYGQLLGLKICLFVVMLGLAGRNRFLLSPTLQTAIATDGATPALVQLRRSIILEGCLGFLVLVIVAWFGTLAPPRSA